MRFWSLGGNGGSIKKLYIFLFSWGGHTNKSGWCVRERGFCIAIIFEWNRYQTKKHTGCWKKRRGGGGEGTAPLLPRKDLRVEKQNGVLYITKRGRMSNRFILFYSPLLLALYPLYISPSPLLGAPLFTEPHATHPHPSPSPPHMTASPPTPPGAFRPPTQRSLNDPHTLNYQPAPLPKTPRSPRPASSAHRAPGRHTGSAGCGSRWAPRRGSWNVGSRPGGSF